MKRLHPGVDGERSVMGTKRNRLTDWPIFNQDGKRYYRANMSNIVFLDGMPATFKIAQLRLLVFPCGKVTSLKICLHGTRGSCGFVEFSHEEGAVSAVKLLNTRNLVGKNLYVCFARTTAPNNP